MSVDAAAARREKLRRLASEGFDLLVVGGGINGAGIAREAALRGLRTALVDKGDFACGTSSRSSKLIHGGIRYLEHGNVGLVLEASRERDLLRRKLAPHLVRPLPFFFPVYRGGPVGRWKLRAGLLAYDFLAAFRNIARHQMAGTRRSAELEPCLRREGLEGGALYYDCMTDDARLVLETVLAAEGAGAVCLNYVELESFEKSSGRIVAVRLRDLEDEGESRVPVHVVVNATGPWLDRVRDLDQPGVEPVLRPTKGVHLVVPRDRVGNRHAVVLHAVRDQRVLFAIPWDDLAIIGTTDTDFDGDLDRVEAEDEDVDYLLETVNHCFPDARLTARDVVSTWAGLRPLIAGGDGDSPSEVSREEELIESASGLISLGGGKLTTYRRVAIKAVDLVAGRLAKEHGLRVRSDSGTDRLPLPGGESRGVGAASSDPANLLVPRYGGRAGELLRHIEASPDLAAPLAAPTLRVEAWYAAAAEMAIRVEDVLRRRTQVALRQSEGAARLATEAAELMAEPLGWKREDVDRHAEEYRRLVATYWAEPREREA